MSDDERYDEIMRRIAQRQQRAQAEPAQMALADVLDALNAAGLLADVARKRLPILCYGPRLFRGVQPAETGARVWAGAVLWHRPRGYYGYKTLSLLGIWALAGAAPLVALAAKTLLYSAPVYNPESYQFQIKRRFDLHYEGDASPPVPALWRFSLSYDAAQRLAQRAALAEAVAAWADSYPG
jgi:hypothetical protein